MVNLCLVREKVPNTDILLNLNCVANNVSNQLLNIDSLLLPKFKRKSKEKKTQT